MITEGDYQKEIDVNIQSQTSTLFQYFLIDELNTTITLTAPVAMDDEIINVSAGHGFIAGNILVIREGDIFEQVEVLAVNVDAITIAVPSPVDFPITSEIIRGSKEMAVDGSGTQVEFKYSSNCCGSQLPVVPIDIEYIVMTMRHATAGDDSKFGNLNELTKGFYFRKEDGERVNLGNYQKNEDFQSFGAEVIYKEKSGGGEHSTVIMFDIQKIFGQVVRFDPRVNDFAIGVVRDALQTLNTFTVSLLGSFTSGE